MNVLSDIKNDSSITQDEGIALVYVFKKGLIEVVKLLLGKNANVNTVDSYGWTALMLACRNGYIEIVQELLTNNADVSITNECGDTAIIVASKHRHVEIVLLLLMSRVDIYIREGKQEVIKAFNIANWRQPEMEGLLSGFLNNNFVDNNAFLFYACEKGFTVAVEMLLNEGANVNVRNAEEQTPLLLASKNKHAEIVGMLLNAKADPGIKDPEGMTAIMLASDHGSHSIVKMPLDYHDVDEKSDEELIAALGIAKTRGHENIIMLLEEQLHPPERRKVSTT
jgi:ankyrin repeat protein